MANKAKIDVATLLTQISDKFTQKGIKSMDVFKEFGNPGYNALLKHGVKTNHGTYSLEAYFGGTTTEAPAPAVKAVKEKKAPTEKAATPSKKKAAPVVVQEEEVKEGVFPKRASYSDLATLRRDFEAVGIATTVQGSGEFTNELGTWYIVHGILYRKDVTSPTGVRIENAKTVQGLVKEKVDAAEA